MAATYSRLSIPWSSFPFSFVFSLFWISAVKVKIYIRFKKTIEAVWAPFQLSTPLLWPVTRTKSKFNAIAV